MKTKKRIIGVLRILIPLAGLLNYQNMLMSGFAYYFLVAGLMVFAWTFIMARNVSDRTRGRTVFGR